MRKLLAALVLALAVLIPSVSPASAYDGCYYPNDRKLIFRQTAWGTYQKSGSAYTYGWANGSATRSTLNVTAYGGRKIHQIYAFDASGLLFQQWVDVYGISRNFWIDPGHRPTNILEYNVCVGSSYLV